MSSGPATDLEEKFDRLTRLVGTDEGFYILALHSFVEYYLRYQRGYGEGPSFGALTWTFREELLRLYGEDTFIDGLYCLGRLGKQHRLTHQVRHRFERMDPGEAAAATHLFITFCRLADIHGLGRAHLLERSLDIWKERTCLIEQSALLRSMQAELRRLQSRNKSLLAQRGEYERLKMELEEAQLRLYRHDLEIQRQREADRGRKSRLDGLRRERNALIQERDRLLGDLERFQELERYLLYLGRLSLYTRTRMDYEQSICQLTPEQEQVLSSISLRRDFLVRGGPGTGKSLVLIQCLRQAVMQNELDLGQNESVVLVTFTRTLAKYDRYIAEILGMDLPVEVISTVDTLFFTRLRTLLPGVRYDFQLPRSYFTRERTPAFLSPEEMASEVENFIFANAVRREEYLEELVPRQGMRRRLSRQQRREVWKAVEGLVARMEESGTYSKDYGRLKLLRHLEEHPEDRALRNISYLFLDEVQDLTPAALRILRELTRGAMIMAGDQEQSLYNHQWPLGRAGITLRGATRVLKTNFRNTRQIHELAERFRGQGRPAARRPEAAGPERAQPEAFTFREGPAPEIYVSASPEELKRLLRGKLELFVHELGYDPENICILVPRNVEIQTLGAYLGEHGLEASDVSGEEFTFRQRDRVRISTLHSAKGLDFPVVLLYLPYLHRRRHFDAEQTEKLLRNLVYVGISRGMDNVNVFTTGSGDPVLRDLIASF